MQLKKKREDYEYCITLLRDMADAYETLADANGHDERNDIIEERLGYLAYEVERLALIPIPRTQDEIASQIEKFSSFRSVRKIEIRTKYKTDIT
jgi:hypothetical protein